MKKKEDNLSFSEQIKKIMESNQSLLKNKDLPNSKPNIENVEKNINTK